MQNRINPVGLKGNEVNERIKQLIGAITPITEEAKNSVIELTKMGPDGNVYAIVREGHRYFIKSTEKKANLMVEDFNYMGGLQNKTDEAYPSYSKAIKHLNIKFNSLAEAVGKVNTINVFENDNATVGGFSQYQGNGFTNEGNLEGNEPIVTEDDMVEEDIELTEEEQAVQDMMEDETEEVEEKMPVTENKKLSVARLMNDMDDIIDGLSKKKNYKLI